jgi:tripartite ATP-independent transporter DctP family solute receptor
MISIRHWKAITLGFVLMGLVGIIVFVLPGPAAQAAEKTITLRLGHESIPESQWGRTADWFAATVNYRTNGRVKIDVYPSCQLGTAQELIEACKMGIIDIVWTYPSQIARFVPKMGVLDPTFLFKDVASMYAFAEGPIAAELNEECAAKGIQMLAYSYMGTRHMTCNMPVYKPEDLKGVKIRSMPTPVALECIRAMGATPTPVAWEELYGALESGIVEGQENPVAEIIDMKFYQVQKYLMLTGHQLMFTLHVVSDKTWQKLPRDVQKTMMEVAHDMVFYNEGLVEENTARGLKFLSQKLKVIGPEDGLDLAAFRKKALNEIPPKFDKEWGDLYRKIATTYAQ